MESRDNTRYSHLLVPLGQVTVTPAALREFYQSDAGILGLLDWHRAGNWGDAAKEYWSMNDQALRDGGTVISMYEDRPQGKGHREDHDPGVDARRAPRGGKTSRSSSRERQGRP
ncbi:MAG TPA: hypothetical protein VOA80_07540 [Thermoanaerobaculia bacterium]|nr:hypothetical protein [Thermoanaerobaculia bacterium]